jgi:hypothetical protein
MKRNGAVLLWVNCFALGLSSVSVCVPRISAQSGARSEQRIPYLSGGIGLDEREALRSRATEYNLMLSFAEKTGKYLSDVEVGITNAQGDRVVAAVSDGPWFFITLPPGSYTVRASTLGKTLQQVATVSANRQTRLYFYW